MLGPNISATILVVFILLFGVVLPVLNIKFKDFVSYRWCVLVVVLALLIGATTDFAGLPDDSRHVILVGGLVIAGGYVLLRTVEKILANGWLKGSRIELRKGDAEAVIASDEKKKIDESRGL